MTISVQIVQLPPGELVQQREFHLMGDSFKIGRDYEADIALSDMSETMSRTHVEISRGADGRYSVIDVSANGSFLNAEKLPPQKPVSLGDGDLISFAGYKLLLGIIEAPTATVHMREVEPEVSLNVETDFADEHPLLPDAAIEELPPEPDHRFASVEEDLNAELMFDPFAEGPSMKEPPKKDVAAAPRLGPEFEPALPQTTPPPLRPHSEFHETGYHPVANATHRPGTQLNFDQVNEAMGAALDRFLNEVDPSNLQEDYDHFMPMFARRGARYWKIHRGQFSKKRANGEYKRMFMALLVEEMRKT